MDFNIKLKNSENIKIIRPIRDYTDKLSEFSDFSNEENIQNFEIEKILKIIILYEDLITHINDKQKYNEAANIYNENYLKILFYILNNYTDENNLV